MFLGDLQARVRKPSRKVTVGEDRIVRENQEWDPILFQRRDEVLSTGKSAILFYKNAVHIRQPCANWGHIRQCGGK